MDLSTPPKLDSFSQHTTVYIDPSKLEDFWKAFQNVYDKTADAPECVYFEVFEDVKEAGKISWIANWNASAEWVMTVHLTQEVFQDYFKVVEPLFVKPFEIEIWKRKVGYVVGKKANFADGAIHL